MLGYATGISYVTCTLHTGKALTHGDFICDGKGLSRTRSKVLRQGSEKPEVCKNNYRFCLFIHLSRLRFALQNKIFIHIQDIMFVGQIILCFRSGKNFFHINI
jgi:hypothetical protein